MRKITAMLLVMVSLLSISVPMVAISIEKKATASTSSFVMDGKKVTFDSAYEIEGYNYIQLRSIAAMLNGTRSQFNVYWDEALRQAVIETGAAYTGVKPVVVNQETFSVGEEVAIKNTKITIDRACIVDKIPESTFTASQYYYYFEVTFTVLTSNYPTTAQRKYWPMAAFIRGCSTDMDFYGSYFQVVPNDRIFPNEPATITIYFDIPRGETVNSITISDGTGTTKLVKVN